MACKCKHAYKKRGDVSIHCRAIEGKMDYCGHQKFCQNTGQWEINCTGVSCPKKEKPAVK